MDFKVGDVVMLKSGGPKMTVSWAGEVNFIHSKVFLVECEWFDKGTLKKERFEPKSLEKTE